MPVIAIVNRKGGSGKSTLSTNISGWCAGNGWRVMLGDVDRQQSIRSWLSRRSQSAAPITTWALDNGKVFRAPPGTTHVVLDTPGALYDHELAKLIVWVDAVVVPIGPSVFDQDASAAFLAEVQRLPKVRSGRCKVAAIGMRWPRERMQEWSQGISHQDIPLLTVIPDAPEYRHLLETGSSLFDDPDAALSTDRVHWLPLIQWLDQVWHPMDVTTIQRSETKQRSRALAEPTGQEPISPFPLQSTSSAAKQSGPVLAREAIRLASMEPSGVLRDVSAIPAYLLKAPKADTKIEANTPPSLHREVVSGSTPDLSEQPHGVPTRAKKTVQAQPVQSRSPPKKGWFHRVFQLR